MQTFLSGFFFSFQSGCFVCFSSIKKVQSQINLKWLFLFDYLFHRKHVDSFFLRKTHGCHCWLETFRWRLLHNLKTLAFSELQEWPRSYFSVIKAAHSVNFESNLIEKKYNFIFILQKHRRKHQDFPQRRSEDSFSFHFLLQCSAL